MTKNTKRTIDHDEIQEWIEVRDGVPSIVRRAVGSEGDGILRVDFGEPEEELQEISWDEFFRIFDDNDLAFIYQETTADGELSRFCKFISRSAVEGGPEEDGAADESADEEEDDPPSDDEEDELDEQ